MKATVHRITLSNEKLRDLAILVLALVVCAVASIVVTEQKAGFFLDEYLTLLRANAPTELLGPPVTLSYTPAMAYFQDYLAVHTGHEFDYVSVWLNETRNVHPPLYYFLVHTLCSFVPGEVAEWSMMVINVVFVLLTLIVGQKLVRIFTKSRLVLVVALIAFSLSAGVLNAVAFLRMYCMSMLWCTLFCYLLCARLQRSEPERFFNGKLALTVFAGAMTHYYCIVYFVFAFMCFIAWLAAGKQIKQIGFAVLAMLSAGIASVAFFPVMLHQIFSGYRGEESWSNLSNTADFFVRLEAYLARTDSELFGSIAPYLVALMIVLAIAVVLRRIKPSPQDVEGHKSKNLLWQMAILIVPVVLFFLVVVKISVYWGMNRYLYPIYPLVIWSFAIAFLQLSSFALPRNLSIAITCVTLVIMTASGLMHASWSNLYLNQAQAISAASGRNDLACVVITDTNYGWPAYGMVECKQEACQYASLRFIDPNELNELEDFSDCDELMLFIDDDLDEKSIEAILSSYGLPSNIELVYDYTEFASYHLSRNAVEKT